MAIRSFSIYLFLAAVLGAAHAVEVAGGRQFIGSDLTGEFELFVKQGKCPQKILHKDFKAGPQGTYIIPHNKIAQNGVECTGDGVLGVVSKETLESLGGLDTLLEKKDIAPIVQELKNQGSSFLVGLENAQRTCGGTTIAPNSIFLFVEEGKEIEIPGLINLFPGAKYMIIYEENSPVPCTYFSKSSSRAIGEPAPSPKPINAIPVPGSVSGSDGSGSRNTEDSATGSVQEDGSGFDGTNTGFGTGAGPTEEPSESAESDGASTCFPPDALVTLKDGSTKPMSHILIGDRVLVAPGVFSDVFMFTHRDPKTSAKFIDLTIASGANLQLTPGHYMYVNGRIVAASTVCEGDIVDLANGEASTVTGVRMIVKNGIYNPQTVHGDIVVNGVVASTYTTTVAPSAAHSLLAPLRAAFRSIGVSSSSLEYGSDTLAAVSPKGASTL